MKGAATIKTAGGIAESEKINRVAGYALDSHVIARSAQVFDLLSRLCIVTIVVLCSIVWLLTATSNAQELPASTSNASRLANGWWSLKTAESETAPQLRISIAELTPLEASDLLRTSSVQLTSYLTEPRRFDLGSAGHWVIA